MGGTAAECRPPDFREREEEAGMGGTGGGDSTSGVECRPPPPPWTGTRDVLFELAGGATLRREISERSRLR